MKKTFIIHPFLISLYPVLLLYHQNIKSMPLNVIFVPLLASACFSLLFFYFLVFLIKNKEKAAIILSYFLILFFYYGRYYERISGLEVFGIVIGSYKSTLILWGIIFVIPVYRTLKTNLNLSSITKFANITAGFLAAFNIILIAYSLLQSEVTDKPLPPVSKKTTELPDIYYIILDAYASNEILKDLYGYDNQKFLQYLSSKGFYIASKSRSNYAFTELSIASSLNFTYLDFLTKLQIANNNDRIPLLRMIKKNRLLRFLKDQGYKTFAFSSGHCVSEKMDVDSSIAPKFSLSHFFNLLINTTPLPPVTRNLQYNLHRNRILFTLEQLPKVAKIESPKFIFAHIFAPHPPFVFGESNDSIDSICRCSNFSFNDGKHIKLKEDYIKCYKDQLIFLNDKLKEAIEGIMANSEELPVIIFQGDHGPRSMVNLSDSKDTLFTEAMSILLACKLPQHIQQKLYPTITPVNIFRIILDNYFGTDLGVLEDKSYFSTDKGYYKFIDLSGKI